MDPSDRGGRFVNTGVPAVGITAVAKLAMESTVWAKPAMGTSPVGDTAIMGTAVWAEPTMGIFVGTDATVQAAQGEPTMGLTAGEEATV